jgi:ATP-dependent phosphofructokinase / diphosphate-dependent phosphofructokinase
MSATAPDEFTNLSRHRPFSEVSMMTRSPIQRLAMLVGGGPAPGINGVISAVTIEAINRGIEVYGIQDGYQHLVNPSTIKSINDCIQQYGFDQPEKWLFKEGPCGIRRLYLDDVTPIYSRGGSILGTSRTNPTKKKEDMDRVLKVFTTMGFDALVSIGGDDTAYTASRVYQSFKESGDYIRVAHVPKTIDNDLPLPGSTPTFGFETARHHGVRLVRSLAEDARTTSRWYIVISMGRNAGHLALGIGKASAATVTIIPEEFGLDDNKKPKAITIKHLCDIILGSIIKRYAEHDRFGVIVLAEGLIESVKDELKKILDNTSGKYGTYKTDDHGHLRLGEIEFGKLIRDLLTERLVKLKNAKDAETPPPRLNDIIGVHAEPFGLDVTFITKDLGYELRSADPIPFDAEYTRDLGYSAVKFLLEKRAGQFGAIIGFIDGGMKPMKFEDMLDKKTNRMQIRLVNVAGEGYEVASRYMIRLDADDFNNPANLMKLADAIHMAPEEFSREFAYLI